MEGVYSGAAGWGTALLVTSSLGFSLT